MDRFPLKIALRIDWSEIDLFGHVNNIAILKYVQAARVCCLEAMGLMQSQAEIKMGPILASTSCQFRKPLFYPGQVTVHSAVDQIKNTSFRIYHTICNDNGEVAAEAQDIIVLFDFNKQTKLAIPGDLRVKIEKLQSPPRP
jgi:acyl-CoA thioester hydrolase